MENLNSEEYLRSVRSQFEDLLAARDFAKAVELATKHRLIEEDPWFRRIAKPHVERAVSEFETLLRSYEFATAYELMSAVTPLLSDSVLTRVQRAFTRGALIWIGDRIASGDGDAGRVTARQFPSLVPLYAIERLEAEDLRRRAELSTAHRSTARTQGVGGLDASNVGWSIGRLSYRPLSLTSDDEALVRRWPGGTDLRNLSARAAELVAMRFFAERDIAVEDVSIHQLTGQSEAWRDGDLAVPAGLVDVKNSRRSYSSTQSYSSHCIPRFKDRFDREVQVMGVLSPYAKAREISFGETDSIVVLGFTSKSRVEKLTRRFSTGRFRLEFQRFYPPWLFEFPPEYYAYRGPELTGTEGGDAGSQRPASEGPTPAGDRDVVERFESTVSQLGLTLPTVFLSLLEAKLLFGNDGCSALQQHVSARVRTWPLGTPPDPSECLTSLEHILTRLDSVNLQSFNTFHLSSRQILRGVHVSGTRQTLFAYCGGWRSHGAPCGCFPLVIGENEVCPSCHYLVCSKCGFCQDGCIELVQRGYEGLEYKKKLADYGFGPYSGDEPWF